jgi:hypothetical protein
MSKASVELDQMFVNKGVHLELMFKSGFLLAVGELSMEK